MPHIDKSNGHLEFLGDFEYFHGPDGTLYRGLKSNPLDLKGYRQGGRFECTPRRDNHWGYMRLVRGEPAGNINPLHVGCHLCHAHCGVPCRWSVSEDEPFHNRRILRAATISTERQANPDTWAERHRDIEHAIANGMLCTDIRDGICHICGTDLFVQKSL